VAPRKPTNGIKAAGNDLALDLLELHAPDSTIGAVVIETPGFAVTAGPRIVRGFPEESDSQPPPYALGCTVRRAFETNESHSDKLSPVERALEDLPFDPDAAPAWRRPRSALNLPSAIQ
jgi:hypothetical protein